MTTSVKIVIVAYREIVRMPVEEQIVERTQIVVRLDIEDVAYVCLGSLEILNVAASHHVSF